MIQLTDATPADAGPLALILGQWIAATEWMPKLHTAEEDVGFLGRLIATRLVRVARDGSEAAGFLARQGGEVDALYIGGRHRRRGIGTALVQEAKAIGELTLWTFQANTHAIAFYRQLGFAEIARTDGRGNDERLPDLRLHWRAEP